MPSRPARIALAALGLTLAAAGLDGRADGVFPVGLRPADQERLASFETARTKAVAAARAGGPPDAVATLDAVLAGAPQPIVPAEIAGAWRCRTIRLGGEAPLRVYPDFRCRIVDDAGGLRLEKLSGSERTAGTFYDLGQARLGYAGALAYGAEGPRGYGETPARDQVGYLVALGPDRLRLELPRAGGRFDILELRR